MSDWKPITTSIVQGSGIGPDFMTDYWRNVAVDDIGDVGYCVVD